MNNNTSKPEHEENSNGDNTNKENAENTSVSYDAYKEVKDDLEKIITSRIDFLEKERKIRRNAIATALILITPIVGVGGVFGINELVNNSIDKLATTELAAQARINSEEILNIKNSATDELNALKDNYKSVITDLKNDPKFKEDIKGDPGEQGPPGDVAKLTEETVKRLISFETKLQSLDEKFTGKIGELIDKDGGLDSLIRQRGLKDILFRSNGKLPGWSCIQLYDKAMPDTIDNYFCYKRD